MLLTPRVPTRCESLTGPVREEVGHVTFTTGWPTVLPGEPLSVVSPRFAERQPEGYHLCECRYGRLLLPESHAVCHRCRNAVSKCSCWAASSDRGRRA